MPTLNLYVEGKASLPTKLFRFGKKNIPFTFATESDSGTFENEFTVGATTTVKLMSIGSGVEDDLTTPKFIFIEWSDPTNGTVVITWDGASATPVNSSGFVSPTGRAGFFVFPGYQTVPHDSDTASDRAANTVEAITAIYLRNNGSADINVSIQAVE